MNSYENTRDLLLRYAEVKQETADGRTLVRVKRFSLAIFSAGIHKDPHDYRPDELEADLEAIRKQINELVDAISQLNPWAAEIARREAERARLLAAGVPEDLLRIQMMWHEAPVTEWIDQKAITSLKGLSRLLK